jgi:hypothetical protein
MRTTMPRRTLLAVLALMVAGGIVAAAVETEGLDHQPEVHHCMACCTNHHVADAAKAQATPRPLVPQENPPLIEPPMLYQQAVIRLPDPPPKFLA